MDEVKIWSVDGDSNVEPLASKGQTDTESLLEDTLVKNPDMLIPGLKLVGRQTPTAGGPLDLLGVDEEGRLVVFELKRGTLSRDAVAQIIDYASDLEAMDLDALASHISEHSGKHGINEIEDFQNWYSRDLESLKPLRLFLVGLGVDDRTERMVRFLADNSEMDISLLTFHGFEYDGKTLLARQVEVEGPAESESTPRRTKRSEKIERWKRRLNDAEISGIFDAMMTMIQENWPGCRTSVGVFGRNIRLSGSHAMYARVEPQDGEVWLVFFPRTKALCPNEFSQPVDTIRYITWPEHRTALDPSSEIKFRLNSEEWETHKDHLSALTKAVYEAWESSAQEEDSS